MHLEEKFAPGCAQCFPRCSAAWNDLPIIAVHNLPIGFDLLMCGGYSDTVVELNSLFLVTENLFSESTWFRTPICTETFFMVTCGSERLPV